MKTTLTRLIEYQRYTGLLTAMTRQPTINIRFFFTMALKAKAHLKMLPPQSIMHDHQAYMHAQPLSTIMPIPQEPPPALTEAAV